MRQGLRRAPLPPLRLRIREQAPPVAGRRRGNVNEAHGDQSSLGAEPAREEGQARRPWLSLLRQLPASDPAPCRWGQMDGHVGVDGLVVGHARADRVAHGDAPLAERLHPRRDPRPRPSDHARHAEIGRVALTRTEGLRIRPRRGRSPLSRPGPRSARSSSSATAGTTTTPRPSASTGASSRSCAMCSGGGALALEAVATMGRAQGRVEPQGSRNTSEAGRVRRRLPKSG